MMLKKIAAAIFILNIPCVALAAQDITVLYSGDTHAMLYPCNCPVEPDGGIARRAVLVKSIRQETPDVLLVDSGAFLAAGLMDEYTQNTELDMQRSLLNLKAMELMRYDAVNISADEFNFGGKFLREIMAKSKLHFISANIKSPGISPYVVKEIKGIKIGIIGVISPYARQKAGGAFDIADPKQAVQKAVNELKAKGVKFILLLSRLGENQDLKIIRDIPGIDVVITSQGRMQEHIPAKVGNTIILKPSWQGRRLGKLSLTIEDNRITKYKADELRLSDKIKDDPDILKILPRCFSDANCKKDRFFGACMDPGLMQARCIFNKPRKVSLLVIVPQACNTCDPQRTIRNLTAYFPGARVSYLYYPRQSRAKKIIKDLDLKFLPVYLLGREIEKEDNFDDLKGNLVLKGDFYMVSPQLGGIGYFLDRKNEKGKLDVSLSLYDKKTPGLLEAITGFQPVIHFLAVEKNGSFDAGQGKAEVEEYMRSLCVKKYYPESFFDYISCRSRNIGSSWWQDCLGGADAAKIMTCARGPEGAGLLRENISLNKELSIMSGPTYLVDNRQIFSTEGVPNKEDFKKIFNR
ncbi:MAG: hypothetical protein PHF11_02570 [Candidatus Omnitrophica bacterium]|nr:hypothetical protein [Candidatus Omnitrophota bacterium]